MIQTHTKAYTNTLLKASTVRRPASIGKKNVSQLFSEPVKSVDELPKGGKWGGSRKWRSAELRPFTCGKVRV